MSPLARGFESHWGSFPLLFSAAYDLFMQPSSFLVIQQYSLSTTLLIIVTPFFHLFQLHMVVHSWMNMFDQTWIIISNDNHLKYVMNNNPPQIYFKPTSLNILQ